MDANGRVAANYPAVSAVVAHVVEGHIGHCDWQGTVVQAPVALNLGWEGGDRKISPQIIVAQLPSDPPTKNNL